MQQHKTILKMVGDESDPEIPAVALILEAQQTDGQHAYLVSMFNPRERYDTLEDARVAAMSMLAETRALVRAQREPQADGDA